MLSSWSTYLSIYLSVCLSVCLSVYLSVYLSIHLSMALQPLWTLAVSQFLNIYTVGRTLWMGNHSIARPQSAHRTTQIQNKRTQTSMPQVGFEPTIAVFERAETVYALNRANAVIGVLLITVPKYTSVVGSLFSWNLRHTWHTLRQCL
jgi:hypothetical protein